MRGTAIVRIAGRFKRAHRALALACALALAGCAGESAKTLIPSAAPRLVGTGVDQGFDRERARLLATFGGEYRAPAVRALLDDVVRRLVAASDEPGRSYRVTILNSPAPNAFALPGGDLFITRGLLALANDTSEVAAVMAHEVAHVTARHALQRAELERRSAIVEQVVAEVLDDRAGSELIQMRNRVGIAGFSRAQELEADEIGVMMTAKAGFDPFGAVRFLESLGRDAAFRAASTGEARKRSGMNFLSSHPSPPERMQRALAAARAAPKGVLADRETERATWLAAVDGIIYGDDSQAGLIRERRFIHPVLGFSFVAPDGTVMENSPQAVIGIIPGRSAALRFDSVKAGGSPEDVIGRGWMDGVSMGRVETLMVNGLPAATAIAAGSDWSFRLAAVRQGDVVHRFIFAARELTPDIDRSFRATLDSFRILTADEAARARPLMLRSVTARGGETAEAFVRAMATERPLERFLVLNGLESPTVTTGRSYKIVTE